MTFENSVSLFAVTMVCLIKKALCSAIVMFIAGSTTLLAQDNIILKNGTELPAKVLEISGSSIKYKRQDNPDGPVYTYSIKDVLLIKYANETRDVFGKQSSGFSVAGIDTMQRFSIAETDRIFYKGGFFTSPFADAQGKTLSNDQTRSILLMTPGASKTYQQGKALRVGGYVTAAAGLGLIGAGLGLAVLSDGGSEGDHKHENDMGFDENKTYGDEKRQDHHGNGDLKDAGFVIAGAGVLTGLVGIWLSHRATIQFRKAADQFNSARPVSLSFGPSRKGLGLGLALTF